MKFQIPGAVTRAVGGTMLKAKANSPTLLFVAGVGGMVTSTVLACRSTLKVNEVREEFYKTKLDIKTVQHENYSEQDRKHDLTLLYVQTAAQYCKLYGPSVIIGLASIAMLTKSHNILSKRNAALSAAYAAIDKGFKDYRQRVRDDQGDDKDREYLYGKETGTMMVEDTNGVKKKKRTHAAGTSAYSKIFDVYNRNWDDHPEYNVLFLRGQQNYMNDKLARDGHLFLNDVYRALGFEDTPAGSQVGWLYQGDGDGYVDFGIWADSQMTRMHDFLVGREGGIMVDFNVDGPIWDKINGGRKF